MAIRVNCPNCRTAYDLAEEHAGKAMRCAKCQQPFRVPPAASTSQAPAAPLRTTAEPPRERPAPPPPLPRREPSPSRERSAGGNRVLGLVIAGLVGAVVGAASTGPLVYFLTRPAANPVASETRAEPVRTETPKADPPVRKASPVEDAAPKPKPAAPASPWKEVVSEEGRFTVRFPDEPKKSTSKDPSGAVTLTYTLDREGGANTFMVQCSELPAGSDLLPPKVFLAEMAKQLGKNATSQKDVLLDGHPGLEIQVEQDRGGATFAVTQRIYLARGRMYQIITSGLRGKPDPAAGEFLDSFKLMDKPGARPAETKPVETKPIVTAPVETKPVQTKLVETIRLPAGGSLKDATAAWMAKNSAFGPEHKSVKDVTGYFTTDMKDNWGFSLLLGRNVVKSKKPTLLGGWNGSVFVFECDGAAAVGSIPDNAVAFRGIAQGKVQRENQPVTLSDLKVNNAGALARHENIAGSVAYKKSGAAPANLLLRLSYLAGRMVRTKMHYLAALPDESGTINFSYAGVGASDGQLEGPLLLFFEVYVHTGQIDKHPVLSNPVAAAVFVKGRSFQPPARPVAAPRAGGLENLEVKLPAGWKSEYTKFLRSWTFEKYTPAPDGFNESSRLSVSNFLGGETTADAYAEKLGQKDFVNIEYVFTRITAKEKLPDGFLIKGEVSNYKNAKEKPRLGLVVVRDLGGTKVICQSTSLRSEALRQEAIELFGSARLVEKK